MQTVFIILYAPGKNQPLYNGNVKSNDKLFSGELLNAFHGVTDHL